MLAAAPEPTMAASEPTAVVIPAALRARVPMAELSGLIWAPSLDRYLAVIDDSIDLDENNRRGPFVLALDRAGRADAETVPIDGIDALDDAEALAAGPDGATFFLMTSHSPTKKGKARKSRRQLLQLRLEGRGLRVTGALDLLQDGDGVSERLQKVGVAPGTPVDLEGLTFHGGALYVGLKAPLLPDGAAAILRLDNPGPALAAGKLPAGSLSVWGQVRLSVAGQGPARGQQSGTAPPGGPPVLQGIADLLFAADGALYLCANAPKGGPPDGGGALWRVGSPGQGGAMEAKLARRFVGLKPEGIAAAPGGAGLTLVFDRNSRDPLWMTWPLPARSAAPPATRAKTPVK